jgi:hypothetical protein
MWHVGLVSTRPVSPPRIILRRARRIVPDTEVVGKPTRDPAVRGNTHPHMHHHSLTTSIYMILMHRWRDLPIRLLFRLVAHWWLSGVVVIASASLRVHHGQDRPHPHAPPTSSDFYNCDTLPECPPNRFFVVVLAILQVEGQVKLRKIYL